MKIQSYDDCVALAATRKRKLDNNTYLSVYDDHFGVRLHATDVVEYWPDGRIVLKTGGWRTITTKDRINKFSPFVVSQQRGIWYVALDHGRVGTVYTEGMTFRNGKWITPVRKSDGVPAQLKLRAKVQAYVRDYMAAFDAGKVPAPSGGDCWYCSMRPAKVEPVKVGEYTGMSASGPMQGGPQSLGDAFGDTDHLRAHIKERYYVPSLLANALSEPMCPVSNAARDYVARRWSGAPKVALFGDLAVAQLRKALFDYLAHRLGLTPGRTVYRRAA